MAKRISTSDIDAMIALCQINIDELTDTGASEYFFGNDNDEVGKAIHLRKLIYTLQVGANLTNKQLEVVYMEALDKSEAYDTGTNTSTLDSNPI